MEPPILNNQRIDFESHQVKREERYLYHFASEYLDRGWSVIPLHEKKPAIASWKEFQSRRPNRDEIDDWFQEGQHRFTGLGIITGLISGLAVIDCDSPEATHAWLTCHPCSPLMVRTGSGGDHIYYRIPNNGLIGNRVRIGGQKIDFRGEGGYVVGPPSLHPNGNLYSWHHWSDYSLDDVPLLDPTWLQDSTTKRNAPANLSRRQISDAPAYIRKIFANAGERGHDHTFKVACILRDAGYLPEEALAELIVWNETNAKPPWSIKELLHKIKSAYHHG